MYFMLEASAMNRIVGSAPETPFQKLFSTGFADRAQISPARRPKIRKYAIRMGTV